MVEKTTLRNEVDTLQLKSDWVGNGSVSGFDLMITISEIQMLLALFAPLSGLFSVKAGHSLEQNFGAGNQGLISSSDYTIPDGAIVAIKDLHQHLYFAAEAVVGMKYRLAGALHYSLVGEKALFRVRYHKQRRWMSEVTWISLTSLHAKNDAGEPLHMNFCSGSGFVELSSGDDRGWSLWQILPYKHDSYGDDDDLESYSISARKAFHLVNQKNNSGIAFVDGFLVFVRKPGNPLKVKVFHELSQTHDAGKLNVPSLSTSDTFESNIEGDSSSADEYKSGVVSHFPHVNITVDRITFTILHEVSDANDKFPLARGYIDNVHITGQILPSKFRLMSTYFVAVEYFDAQRNAWREIISPVDACFFFHSRFTLKGSENVQQGVPIHFFFKMRQVNVSLTELSLDVLLFLAGKLNVAGPYAVRSSMIFANCCKVENLSGLNLLCHFADDQDAIIAGQQSTSVFLRHIPLADQLPENKSSVSVSLSELGGFSTSPLHISLSNAHVVSWRTRIVSQQDSRTLPGPFIVAEISRTTKEGLSLVVSPLLRIHNESEFAMELRFRRPQQTEKESTSVLLQNGDTIDDSRAVFDALYYSGGLKKALMSLSVGNFLLSFRPDISEYFGKTEKPILIDWSEDIRGGKAVPVSGIFDKLNYRFRKAFGVASVKSVISTVHCPLIVEGLHAHNMYFLIQTIGRDVPVMQPPNVGDSSETKASPVAFQVQKEIFISPTVQVFNLLQTEILVVLTENHPDLCMNEDFNSTGKHAIIPCGSSAYLYANPTVIYFMITLTSFSSKCRPVNSGEWIKKLLKQKSEAYYFDVELDFCGGKYFASLRLSCGDRGILEVTVFTSYTLQNNTELSLFCYLSNQKPLSRAEAEKDSSSLSPELGVFLPPKSSGSWFLKSKRVHLKWLEEKASEASLDLDILSGFTELTLESESSVGVNRMAKVGVSLKACVCKVFVPAQIVSIVPRYVISNESQEPVIFRQCYLEDGMDGITDVEGKQKAELYMLTNTRKRRETSFFDSMLRQHRNVNEDSLVFIQFRLKEIGCSWSGPICFSSLGRFSVKFKRSQVSFGNQSLAVTVPKKKTQFAAVHIVEESSSLVLHFHMPPNFSIPYRIENCLRDTSITYYQKDSVEPEILGAGKSVEYAWDDLNLPHKLVIQISGLYTLREINIDKVCEWKPFLKTRQTKGLTMHLPLNKMSGVQRRNSDDSHGLEWLKLGYEVYADGLTRVLRICEFVDSHKEVKLLQPRARIQFRFPYFAISMLEISKQDEDDSTIIVASLSNITLDSLSSDQFTYYCIGIQSIHVDEKWNGAPFASMLRRSRLHDSFLNGDMLRFVFVLQINDSGVKLVKHSSIVLQPIDLNLDEETLMRLATFWRTSLSDSKIQSQLFYFKHFEIHPIKIRANFLPGNPYSSYSSAQETLRSLLHSVIKVPAIKNKVVELNGVLLTHALVTKRELLIKCAQHYSWYILRAVYIAKGSPLLPPAFASIFDDAAWSSLDVFFDPSDNSINLPGLTIGMFRVISKCIGTKGFSGTKRYFGDLGKTMQKAGSNALFAAITEISDSILKGTETNGFNGLITGFHQGILRLAMEPSLLGAALMEGGPDRKIKLDNSPGDDELYIEGYLQAMLDAKYKLDYLRVTVIENQVLLKNLPPNTSLINEIVENVKSFLVSKALLEGETSTAAHPLRHLRGESEWKIVPTVLTLCEHLFVNFAIRTLRRHADKLVSGIRLNRRLGGGDKGEASLPTPSKESQESPSRTRAVGKFVLSGMLAYVDGRLCRHIPNPIARRIVSGFLLSFLDKKDAK